ncbi:hypothetical protein MHM98_10570 [Psychrobium sp. MM17-31]|uniref:hypothetical protein n=1 Tax=Psychrobium sp. MM17-31 TaxID=2917758 RepID=UPI001EF57DE5|nr:hypothetical protein [Psychrobium sp. MM17-31]MCG7531785.1 hypothetical protein [Psychrobium sp. MM17-31]
MKHKILFTIVLFITGCAAPIYSPPKDAKTAVIEFESQVVISKTMGNTYTSVFLFPSTKCDKVFHLGLLEASKEETKSFQSILETGKSYVITFRTPDFRGVTDQRQNYVSKLITPEEGKFYKFEVFPPHRALGYEKIGEELVSTSAIKDTDKTCRY